MAQARRPSWLDKTDIWVARAPKDAPNFTLPDGKVHYHVPRRTDMTSESVIGKAGVNAVMDTGVAGPQQIAWIHSKIWNNSGKSPATGPGTYPIDSLTQSDVEFVASTIPPCFAEANELYEGPPWGTSDHTRIQFRWFYNKRRQIYEQAGMTYRQYCTYGGWDNYNGDPWQYQTGDGSQKAPNDPFFKAKIASVTAARNSCSYFVTREPEGGGAIIKHYADQVDYMSRYYNKAFAAEVMALGMGATPGIAPEKLVFVMWGKIEGLSGNSEGFQHNGFYTDRQVGNLGILRTFNRHPQVDYDWMVGNWFGIGFCRTNGCLPFDERTKYGTNPSETKAGDTDSVWFPFNGAPIPATSNGYPIEPLQWHDASFEAAYYYSLCARTAGTPWKYCTYTEEGSAKVVARNDGTDILEHASANDGAYSISGRRGRPDAMYRVKGNALDVWVFDPSRGKNSKKNIILEPIPGKQISINGLQGSTLALFNETI